MTAHNLAGRIRRVFASCPDFWKRALLVLGTLIIAIHWYQVTARPSRDLRNHLLMAQSMACGEYIYHINHCYPPFWPLAHVPLSFLPLQAASALLFPLSFLALIVLLFALQRLTQKYLPLKDGMLFWVTALALTLTSRYCFRDMHECGVNMALVALSWLAVWLWTQRREWAGGACLGLAMALKCSPGLFLIYFLWKRQWKMAAISTAIAGVLFLSPLLAMPPEHGVRAYREWTAIALRGAGETNPSVGPLGYDDLLNISLRPALARYLMVIPEGNALRPDHPLYIDFLNLPPETAGRIVKVVSLVLLAGVFWQFRRPVIRRDDPALLWELSAVGVLILLYSPISEGQHAVGLIPAFYLLMRTRFSQGRLPRGVMSVIVAFAVIVLGLNRSLIGKDLTYLLDSYHVQTFCLLALLAAVLACHRRTLQANVARLTVETACEPMHRAA